MSKAEEIAKRNDQFRKYGLRYMITRGVQGLSDVIGLVQAVRTYDHFDLDNDPYGEHDFGSLEWDGQTVFWKIDYYNQTMDGLGDPTAKDCNRMLTVMLSSEY